MRCQGRPINCIIPPHVLLEIEKRGKGPLKEWARQSLMATHRLRGQRDAFASIVTTALPTGKKRRTIYDAQHTTRLPGRVLVRGEGQSPVADPAVNEAYDGAGQTYDFYNSIFHRNSIDDKGMRLDSTVHYSNFFNNAFWNGRQMVYGDGDGFTFQRFTRSLDVIAHELTHGVTEFDSGLEYHKQSGALNESLSDVFGSMIKQWVNNQQARDADWLIGAEILAPDIPSGQALRSLKAPGTAYDNDAMGKDPQPSQMSGYIELPDDDDPRNDSGGVHFNSGIPNHAFYLTATELGGFSWERAGRIWYTTLKLLPGEGATFRTMADATIAQSRALYDVGGPEERAVTEAWRAVGVI